MVEMTYEYVAWEKVRGDCQLVILIMVKETRYTDYVINNLLYTNKS